jgi:hypothetical protein
VAALAAGIQAKLTPGSSIVVVVAVLANDAKLSKEARAGQVRRNEREGRSRRRRRREKRTEWDGVHDAIKGCCSFELVELQVAPAAVAELSSRGKESAPSFDYRLLHARETYETANPCPSRSMMNSKVASGFLGRTACMEREGRGELWAASRTPAQHSRVSRHQRKLLLLLLVLLEVLTSTRARLFEFRSERSEPEVSVISRRLKPPKRSVAHHGRLGCIVVVQIVLECMSVLEEVLLSAD